MSDQPQQQTSVETIAQMQDKAQATTALTVINSRYEPPAIAQHMDADRIMRIFREAETGDTYNYFSLLRDVIASDGFIQSLFAQRKLAVLGDVMSIQPRNKDDENDVETAERTKEMIEAYDYSAPQTASEFDNLTPWLNAVAAIMDSILWPVSVTEKIWRPSQRPGLRFELARLIPVPHHLLDYSTGKMLIWDVDQDGARTGSRHEVDPNRYIVHRGHLLSLPDNWGGPFRGILVWWLLMNMSRGWWAQFLDHFGAPWPVGKYDASDDEGRRVLQRAFAFAKKLGGLVISRETEVELAQLSASSNGQSFDIFRSAGKREIAQIILGQTGTSDTQGGGGIGSGIGAAHESVRQDLRTWDNIATTRTLMAQLFSQFVRINGFKGNVATCVFGSVSPAELKALGELLKNLKEAGFEPTDDALIIISERLGIQLQRVAAPPPVSQPGLPSFSTLSSVLAVQDQRELDQLAQDKAADLAQAFRGSLAPIGKLVLESKSKDDLLLKLQLFGANWTPGRLALITEAAMAVFAARGAIAPAVFTSKS